MPSKQKQQRGKHRHRTGRGKYANKRGRFAKHWCFVLPISSTPYVAKLTPEVDYMLLGNADGSMGYVVGTTVGYVKFKKQQLREVILGIYPEAHVHEANFDPNLHIRRLCGLQQPGTYVGIKQSIVSLASTFKILIESIYT